MIFRKSHLLTLLLAVGLLLVSANGEADKNASISSCERIKKLRKRAGCLLKVERPDAINALHSVAMKIYDTDYIRKKDGHLGISGRQDFMYAAESAGVIAAKTSEGPLLTLRDSPNPWTQKFALRGLSHMLSILRMGHAKGGKSDQFRLAATKDSIATICFRSFQSKDAEVVVEAARCVGQTRDNKHTSVLVKLIVASRSAKTQRGVFLALKNLSRLSQTAALLRPLTKILLRPLPKKWSSDDIWIRGDICGLLASHAKHGDQWAQTPAERAVVAIGPRNSQAKKKCLRLLNRN